MGGFLGQEVGVVHEGHRPLLVGGGLAGGVDEVAPLPELALPLLGVGQAHLRLVCPLLVAGRLELLGAVCELAARAVGAAPVEGEVLAEGSLVLGVLLGLLGGELEELPLLVVCGDVGLAVRVAVGASKQAGVFFSGAHGVFCKIL